MTVTTAIQVKPEPTVTQLLRFSTAGSVDDGKSTLIGRLLHDSRSLYQDQIDQIESGPGGAPAPNWAQLTDGLKAEREQGITIDVAYRYFSTSKRKFIIADTPGHEQYTRNMATGASTADLTIILIDARKGVRTQSRRHAFIAALMGIPNVVVAVNKMDLVGYRAEVFESITESFGKFMRRLGLSSMQVVPISALNGDHVVNRSEAMAWYEGPTLLEILETAPLGLDHGKAGLRFPVQHVLRPNQDYRGYAGRLASGRVSVGDRVLVLPSKKECEISEIRLFDKVLMRAESGMSVTVSLSGDLDLSRGGMIVSPGRVPKTGRHFEAMLVWFNEKGMKPGRTYVLKQTTQTVRAKVDRLLYRQNVDTLDQETAGTLGLNQIGRVAISTFRDLHFDAYAKNRQTGSFILIDPVENHTLAAGMIMDSSSPKAFALATSQPKAISAGERAERIGHQSLCLWLVGDEPGQRQTFAMNLERLLFDRGFQVVRLHSGRVLPGLPQDRTALGFGALIRVIGLFLEAGFVVIAWQDQLEDHLRTGAREKLGLDRFFEIQLDPSSASQPVDTESPLPWPDLAIQPQDPGAIQTVWERLSQNPIYPMHHL